MLIHQDRLKYRARRLGVIPYITHNMSGLLKNHQYYISLRDQIEFGPGTKSNLGPRPNRIWNHLDGDFRMMTNHTKADTLPWSTYPKVYVICSCKDHWRFQLSQIQLVPNILCTSPIIFKIHYITTSYDWQHKNITTMDDMRCYNMIKADDQLQDM